MKILYLIGYAGGAGTERYVETLLRALPENGDTGCLAYAEPGPLSLRAEELGVETLCLDLSAHSALRAARQLADFCRERSVDVIHAQYPRENVIAILSRLLGCRAKVIYTIHLTAAQGLKWKILNRIFTPHDAAVTAVCLAAAEQARRNGVCADRLCVISNGIEIKPLPPRENRIREEYDLPPDCFVFITLARLAPEKGINVLTDALALLKNKTDRPYACLIAGDGEERELLQLWIDELGLKDRVFCPGYRQDARELLRSADAFVSSSVRNEAMSLAALEAMSCSLPLIMTDVGAGRELSEGCGITVAPGDAGQLADALLLMMSDEPARFQMGARARKRAEEEYDLRRMITATTDLYKKA